jgi:hypothetical protein
MRAAREAQASSGDPWSRHDADQPTGVTCTRMRRPQVGQKCGGSSSRRQLTPSHPPAGTPHQGQNAVDGEATTGLR